MSLFSCLQIWQLGLAAQQGVLLAGRCMVMVCPPSEEAVCGCHLVMMLPAFILSVGLFIYQTLQIVGHRKGNLPLLARIFMILLKISLSVPLLSWH